VIRAFSQAFVYAVVAITLILLLTMTRKMDVFMILAPSLLTGAARCTDGHSFNFANIIALPLVFVMGVDNCIHMVPVPNRAAQGWPFLSYWYSAGGRTQRPRQHQRFW
jgi:hypothetical protein